MGNPVLLDHTQRALNTTEVAAIMGLSIRSICDQAQAGLIPGAFKPSARTKGNKKGKGLHWRFNRMIFMQWWEQQQTPGVKILRPMRKARPRKLIQ
jgi:hypothetical protein